MTLQRYSPEEMDQLALRLFDIAAVVREAGRRMRTDGLDVVELHDKKALEWFDRLESWSEKIAGQVLLETRSQQRKARREQ